MSFANTLSQPLALPCGAVVPNRFGKSAMSETLGTIDNRASKALVQLYRHWADGLTGLLITGNIMVDRRHIGEPHNVAVEDERDLDLLRSWAQAGTRQGNQLWVQLNHPGKQIPKMLASGDTLSPSAIPFTKQLSAHFKTPRALTRSEERRVGKEWSVRAGILRL